MAVKYCPECRHEIAGRGRYCMFCGCDLRKTRWVSVPETEQPEKKDDALDQETGYRRQSSLPVKLILLTAIVAIVIACILPVSGIFSGFRESIVSKLHAGMTFEEAAAFMKRNGFEPKTDPVRSDGKITQEYKSREVYGYTTISSSLRVQEGDGGEVKVVHYYNDRKLNKEKTSWDFLMLKRSLSSKYGDPEYNEESVFPLYFWSDNGAVFLLYTMGDKIIVSESW